MTTTEVSPAELDQELAELYYQGQKLQSARMSAYETAKHMAGAKYFYRGRQRVTNMDAAEAVAWLEDHASEYHMSYSRTGAEQLANIKAATDAWIANANAERQLEEQYTGWSRFFLVTSSNGHIHSSMSCTTCYPTTAYGWLPQLSGQDEAEAVATCGPNLCSVCFPSAPSDWVGGQLTASQAADIRDGKPFQTKEQKREAKAAEKQAKADAKLAKAMPRMHTMAIKVNELVDAFGTDVYGVGGAYEATYPGAQFGKGYDMAFTVYSDMIERQSR